MSLENELMEYLNKPVGEASDDDLYEALTDLARNRADAVPKISGKKKLYYISAEFLPFALRILFTSS